MTSVSSHEPHGVKQTKKATASGWIGSALEYYDFFLYLTASALIFPQLFFPSTDPNVAIIASWLTFAVGYIARPIGAFVLGRWGDLYGRKNVLLMCLFLMGFSTFAVGLLPTYSQIGILAPILLVILRLIQGFAVAGEISGASSMILEHAPFGRRGFFASFTLQGVQFGQILAAAVFIPLARFMDKDAFASWGWRVPFLLSALVVIAGYYIRREVDETPVFTEEDTTVTRAPIKEAFSGHLPDMLRVACMSLMNVIPTVATGFGATFATQPAYGIGFAKDTYLWIPVVGNIVAVLLIPYVGNLSDKIGRRPTIIAGAIGAGLLSFGYLYAISIKDLYMAFGLSILMWGMVYQGYNAVFPSFYPEQFPTRVRVTAMAISQNTGTFLTSLLPALFVYLAPGGYTGSIPLVIGTVTLAICCISAIAAWSARETSRVHMNDLGDKSAQPVPEQEYNRLREAAMAVSN